MQHVSKLTNLGTLLGGLRDGALRCMHTGALRVCLKKRETYFWPNIFAWVSTRILK